MTATASNTTSRCRRARCTTSSWNSERGWGRSLYAPLDTVTLAMVRKIVNFWFLNKEKKTENCKIFNPLFPLLLMQLPVKLIFVKRAVLSGDLWKYWMSFSVIWSSLHLVCKWPLHIYGVIFSKIYLNTLLSWYVCMCRTMCVFRTKCVLGLSPLWFPNQKINPNAILLSYGWI